jgi:hypothetical protein
MSDGYERWKLQLKNMILQELESTMVESMPNLGMVPCWRRNSVMQLVDTSSKQLV